MRTMMAPLCDSAQPQILMKPAIRRSSLRDAGIAGQLRWQSLTGAAHVGTQMPLQPPRA